MLYMDDFNRTSSTPPTNWALFQPLLPSTGRITQYHKSKLDARSRSVAGKWDTHFCLHLTSNDGEKKELDYAMAVFIPRPPPFNLKSHGPSESHVLASPLSLHNLPNPH